MVTGGCLIYECRNENKMAIPRFNIASRLTINQEINKL